MDYERINKIKSICFSSKIKKQPSQFRNKQFEKENIEYNKPNDGRQVKNFQKKKDAFLLAQEQKQFDLLRKSEKLQNNLNQFNAYKQQQTKSKLQQLLQEQYQRKHSSSPIREARSSSPFQTLSTQKIRLNLVKQQQFYYSPKLQKHSHTQSFGYTSERKNIQFHTYDQQTLENNDDDIGISKEMQIKTEKIQENLNMLIQIMQQGENNNLGEIVNNQSMNELQQRLNGAFERIRGKNKKSQQMQIIDIVEKFLTDVYYKIEQKVFQGQNNNHLNNLEIFEQLVFNILKYLTILNLEDYLPQLVQSIFALKFNLAIIKLQNLLNAKEKFKIQTSFNSLRSYYINRSFADQSFRKIIYKQILKIKTSKENKAFQNWQNLINKSKILQKQHFSDLTTNYIKNLLQNTSNLQNYFDHTKQLIINSIQKPIKYIDLILVKENIGYTYVDNEQIKIDLNQTSLLKQFTQSSSHQYENNILIKKEFNKNNDLPFVTSQDQIIKNNNILSVIYLPLFKKSQNINSSKKLKIIIRIYDQIKQEESINLFMKEIQFQIEQMSTLILNTWYSYKKITQQYLELQQKVKKLDNQTNYSEKVVNQLQYLQRKALELNSVENISDLFKIIEQVVFELFNYEKCCILQYSQCQFQKMYDASKCNANFQEIGYVNYTKTEILKEFIQNFNEGFYLNFKQQFIEDQEQQNLNVNGFIDIVYVNLEQINSQNQINNYQSKCDSIFQSSFTISQSQNNIYFLRMEKSICKQKDFEKFDEKFDIQHILKPFSQFSHIVIQKLLLMQQQINKNSENKNNQSKGEKDLSKLSQENDQLKHLFKFQYSVDDFIEEIKVQNLFRSFEDFESSIQQFIYHHIPQTQYLKIFLFKQQSQSILYTYLKGYSNPFSSQCTSKFQCGTPQNYRRPHSQNGFCIMNNQSLIHNQHAQMRSNIITNRAPRKQKDNQQVRSYSQMARNYCNNNMGIPSQLEDISSISIIPDDENNFTQHIFQQQIQHNQNKIVDKNQNNIFQNNSQNINSHLKNRANSKIKRINNQQNNSQIVIQSCKNSKKQQYNIKFQEEQLKRNPSSLSEINTNKDAADNQNKQTHIDLLSNLKDEYDDNINKVISSYDEIRSMNFQYQDFELLSNNADYGRYEFNPLQCNSILQTSLNQCQPILKKNVKNDKSFNQNVDGLILQGKENQPLENMIYQPLIFPKNNQIQGILQIANCDKTKPFSEYDLELLVIFSQKLSQLLSETKGIFAEKLLFQKQLEVSLLTSSLENHSVTKILSLANKLFQSNLQPIKSLMLFLRKTEKLLSKVFNCQLCQILILDQNKEDIVSFDRNTNKMQIRGNIKRDKSIATNHLNKLYKAEIIVYPQDAFSEDENNQLNTFRSNSFNQKIDLPFGIQIQKDINIIPNAFMSVLIKDQTGDPLSVIQLMFKNQDQNFDDQDKKHVKIINQHLVQIFKYIKDHNFLKEYNFAQIYKINQMVKVFNKQFRTSSKTFFRHLLEMKYGKKNVLKNKIIRKHINEHLDIDSKLKEKLQKLSDYFNSFSKRAKTHILNKYKKKVQQIRIHRHKNAAQCIQMIKKYGNILSLRIKDTVFRSWQKKCYSKLNQVLYQDQTFSSDHCFGATFNINSNNNYNKQQQQQQQCDYSSLLNRSNLSILEESSVTSVLYKQAKAVQQMKKLFLKYRIQTYFDKFILKTLYNNKNVKNILSKIKYRQ